MRLAVHSLFDELVKLGAISDEDAQKSVDRLEALEKAKPTGGQVARYAGLGAVAGPAIGTLQHAIEHGHLPTGRRQAAAAVGGALSMGAIPLIRSGLDRRAEVGHLKDYLKQEHVGDYAKNPGAMTDAPQPPTGLSR